MLTRPQVMLLAGLLLLAAGSALTYIARRAHRGQPLFPRRRFRLYVSRRTLSLLRRCLFLRADVPELSALHSLAQPLTEALLRLRSDACALPPLPGDREPRLMALARGIAAEGVVSAASMERMLHTWEADDVTTAERLALPVCTAAAQSELLCETLRALLEDEQDRRRAARFAAQLSRSKRPIALLTQQQLSLTGLATLLTLLRSQRQTVLLELMNQWLAGHGSDAEDIAARHARRQTAMAEELHRAAGHFSSLRLLNWPEAAERCDPLHARLLEDPAGIYPRMTLSARQMLRARAELLAHWLHVGAEALVEAALHLSREADKQTLEHHVGYFLLESAGLSALRTRLALRRGRLSCLWLTHRRLAVQALLWGFSIVCALLFLNHGNPLFMLPAFLVVVGCIPREALKRWKHSAPLPAVEISAVTEELRTLVVLPATLRDPSDALRMLRYLRTVRCALPEHGVDCLLIGDHAPAMTQRSSGDAAILSAAAQGAAALCGEPGAGRFLYMQRARVWQPALHTYGPRGGRRGAVETVCRLIAQGECEDLLDHASFSPAELHRRYAFVLTLDGETRPAPGMLEALLSAAAHPLNTRYPTPQGMRGYSCFLPQSDPAESGGVRLIRPDAYLDALDGLLSPEDEDDSGFLTDSLSGACIVAHARAHRERPADILLRMGNACRQTYRRCRVARWLLPFVRTPSGIVRTPLASGARFALRERLRAAALPVCRCILLLWALLERNAALLFLSLLLPETACLMLHGRAEIWRMLERIVLLPLHGASAVYAAYRAALPLLHRQEVPSLREPESWQSLQIWAQGSAAALCFLLGAFIPPLWPASLLPAASFALFPLLYMRESRELAPMKMLPAADEPSLRRIAEATWNFFRDAADSSPVALPPAWTQSIPAVPVPLETTPESAGMYLMAIVCAKELGFLGAEEAGSRIAGALGCIERFPLRHGLPCRSYTLPSLEPDDETANASSCGVLLASLMTAAQAMRAWLPELPPPLQETAAALDACAARLDISRLYDLNAGLFHLQLDKDGQGIGHALYFSDETLLLSVAACARGLVPPAHFQRLARTCTEAGGEAVPLSRHGGLAAYLLPGLFVPLDAPTANRVIWLQQRRGIDGLWGRSASAEHAFTPRLHYRRSTFGLREAASGDTADRAVFAPYAAALALPFTPEPALHCLSAMQQLGALGPHGFSDAIDMTSGHAQIVHMQDAFHQGVILCAAAHVLADAPLHRYFSGLPAVEACLPLLHLSGDVPLILPPRPLLPFKPPADAIPDRTADTGTALLDAHLIGSREACLAMNALGSSRMTVQDVPLTRFTGHPGEIEGMQLYLSHRGRVYRLTDAQLPGETVFSGGSIRLERLCGSLRARLTLLADPAAGRILHLLEVTNVSTADCRFEVADILPADLNAAPDTWTAARPAMQLLTLRDRVSGRTLYHHMSLSARPHQMAVCTDAGAFLGRGRTLINPASLEEPMADLPAAAGADCLSFRAALTLGGRGQARILFTTALNDHQPPQWQELNGLTSLAALHARAVAEAIPIAPDKLLAASRMTGALLWHGQPHQGARAPLEASLAEPLLHVRGPLLTVTVPDEAAIPRLRECLCIAAWFDLHGQALTLYILCTAATRSLAENAVSTSLRPDAGDGVRILTDVSPLLQEALFAVSGLVIRGEGRSLRAQLDALRQPIRPSLRPALPAPGQLPDIPLDNPGGYGGFDPETGDYLIRLEAYQTTPAPWQMRLCTGLFTFSADESGLCEPFGERILLAIDDGVPFEPLRAGLPMMVRVGGGRIRWRVFAADFTLTLDAACLPGHPAGLRTVRIRSLRKEALPVTLTVTASLAPPPVQHLAAAFDAVLAIGGEPGFLAAAEGPWSADVPDTLSLPVRHEGSRAARLSIRLTAAPGLSASAAWLCGYAQAADDVAGIQEAVRQTGVSSCIRAAIEAAASRMPGLTIHTPEPTLDLLVNHVLPRQVLGSGLSLPLSALTRPEEAHADLLRAIRQCPEGSLRPALMAALHLYLTGDAGILDNPISEGRTLMALCREAILSHRLNRDAPDMSHEALCRALLSATAAGTILAFRDDDSLREHRRSTLNAADTYLWNADHYGPEEHLLLDVQACAALAADGTPRTRKSLRTCWDALYDREHGLICQQLPDDGPFCPGTPRNGGQLTASAVLYLAALAATEESDRAWELLRALNPLHHTDDPVRSETFTGAPWLLPAGMYAAPAAPGRASGEDASSAALLLTLIVSQLLGLRLRDGQLDMKPCVPADWDGFSVTLRIGASTWRIEMERGLAAPMRDGVETSAAGIALADDGKIHQLRLPLA